MMTYPGFQALPRAIKKMLLESEAFFFEEAQSHASRTKQEPVIAPQWLDSGLLRSQSRWQPAFGRAWSG